MNDPFPSLIFFFSTVLLAYIYLELREIKKLLQQSNQTETEE